jgi:hypothetical protein
LNKVLIGKINAGSVFISWFGLLCFFIWLAYALITDDSTYDYTVLLTIGLTVVFGLVHLVTSFWVRCPHCNKCLTIQGFKEPHPESSGDWGAVVFKWFSGHVVCIHCGQTVDTNGL